jgi:hypothetical protein
VGLQNSEVIAVARRALRALLALRKGLLGSPFLFVSCIALAGPLDAGTRSVKLHAKDGTSVDIGQVTFAPRADGRIGFAWKADTSRFTDHFLSMREFKCLPGQGEIMCLVPYPYPQPGTIAANDFAWLEHSLLFMFKKQSEFGAQLWNGVIWKLTATPTGFVGAPQAVDLNRISAPPAKTDVPPYGAAHRDEMAAAARWYGRLTID